MAKKNNYIIHTPHYREDVGGHIALHRLCHLLNEMGESSYLWPSKRSLLDCLLGRNISYFITNPAFNTPIAKLRHLRKSIIIYPEIVTGNPLKAKNCVRWLLHKPGFHSGVIDYGKNDLFFYYNEQFNDKTLNPDPDTQLRIIYFNQGTYQNENLADRQGQCFLIRKGKGKKYIHENGAIPIDGLSHAETAKVFNATQYFISYDAHTFYTRLAAMCGCIPIVVPDEGISKEEWKPDINDRYGLAYGIDDLDWAIETQHKIPELLEKIEFDTKNQIENFIEKCEQRFGYE